MEPIRARTEGERKAFIIGYAYALIDVREQGFEAAREILVILNDSTYMEVGGEEV